jgi:mono/diheme cytochrome c family protein
MKAKRCRYLGLCATMLMLVYCGVFAQAAAGAANHKLIQRGHYLATAADCAACHTAPGGKPYAGGLPIPTPVGSIIVTNITPSKTAGIGNYTLQQFGDAVRKGVRADGANLYPAMPYTSYALLSDKDVKALYAYFMHGVAPVDTPATKTHLPFPFNIRLSMAVWDWLFLDTQPFQPDPKHSAQWNRGAYLARGLAHCSTCHTPRNMLMAEETSKALSGGKVGPWRAPNITSDVKSGIGGWSKQELVDYLRTGHAPGKAQAAGSMAEAVDQSFRHLKTKDLRAIATYIKTVPAVHDSGDTRPPYKWGSPVNNIASVRGVAVPKNQKHWSGTRLYHAYCATCHGPQGQGSVDGGMPALVHDTTLGRTNTNNLVLVVLNGIHRQANKAGLMPAFADDLSDQQITKLGGYVLKHFGNPHAQITAQQVGQLRSGTTSSSLVTIVQAVLIVIAVIIVLIIAFFAFRFWRRRRAATG